jgi:hypothetical protein
VPNPANAHLSSSGNCVARMASVRRVLQRAAPAPGRPTDRSTQALPRIRLKNPVLLLRDVLTFDLSNAR